MKLVGKVKEAHGLRGELYILIFAGDISWLKKMQSFELRPKGSEAEGTVYPVEKVKPFKDGFILKTPAFSDRTAAEKIKGQDFLVSEELFISKPGETIFLKEILDFMVKNVAQENIGPIKGFSSNGSQDLLVVQTATGTAEIPFVEAFIKKIDFKHRTVVMDLPEGLLDLENL
ncbi:MAG: 16S rRNA processing protein RimM [Bdellovibrionaceae bacterium]|nr:16S rRNA processing protein RimM [Pseudobdellovibrionaceae bacterium]